MDLYNHPERYFEDAADYLAGDMGYRPMTNRIIIPFTANEVSLGNGRERVFNKRFSSARVNVEHAIGLMKIRFPIVNSLTFNCGTKKANKRAVRTMETVAILHNYLLDQQDIWKLSRSEHFVLSGALDDAHDRMINSEWNEHMENVPIPANDVDWQRQAGIQKRQWLMGELEQWRFTGRLARREFWWRP
jgi:hypothetical protein